MKKFYFLIPLFLIAVTAFSSTYIKGPALIEGVTSTAASGGTLTLTAASETYQVITGTNVHTVKLPDATTLVLGRKFVITNSTTSGSLVNVRDGSNAVLGNVVPSKTSTFIVTSIGSVAGTWRFNDTVTNLAELDSFTGALPIANGGTNNTTFTSGSMLYYDGTKVAEENAYLFYDATNHAAKFGPKAATSTSVSVPFGYVDVGHDGVAAMSVHSHGTAIATPVYRLTKSRGTYASPTIVNATDPLGVLSFTGFDGTSYNGGSYIRGIMDGTPGAGDMPGALEFYTTPDGTSSGVRAMKIGNDGLVTLDLYTANSIPFFGTAGLLSQDNTNFVWNNTDKRLKIGTGTDSFTIGGSTKGTALTVSGQGGGNAYDVAFHKHSATLNPSLTFARSRGSEATPTVVSSGDALSTMDFVGFDGTDYEYGAQIKSSVDGTPGNNDMPGNLEFLVSPDGSSTPARAVKIANDKTLTFDAYGAGLLHSSSAGAITSSAVALGSADVSGTLGTANGGTGTTSAGTQYGLPYYSTTTAMASTAAGTSTQVLHGNASGAPTWSQVSLTADVTGTLPIANGGTNSTATPTSGGIAYGDGTGLAYSGAGSADNVAVSSGSAPTWRVRDGADTINNCTLTTSVASNALTIAVKTKAGSDPSSTSPCKISFRNATSATGDYSLLAFTAAASIVVSSGSTLGTTNGNAYYLYVTAHNSTGSTVVLGVSGSSEVCDDGSVVSTTAEGGAGAADSAGVIYTTSAITSRPCRKLGRIAISEATAGTWASNATEVSMYPYRPSYAPATAGTSGQLLTAGAGTGPATWTNFTSGSWTPTITNTTNVSASSASAGFYVRLGSYVWATTQIAADPVATGDAEVQVTVPVSSNFTSGTDCGGALGFGEDAGTRNIITADTATDRCRIIWRPQYTSNESLYITIIYQVL